jgi:hypothetical protein
MAKLNLYVPDDLKARMDAVSDNVNWSEVARPAFQAAVANYEHRKGRNMTTAIERLRASKQETVVSEEASGKAEGRRWAENYASYDDLRRVAKITAADLEAEHGAYEALFATLGENVSDDELWECLFGCPAG